jgi:hypothetical protein
VSIQFPVRVVAWAVMRVTAHLFDASTDLEDTPATTADDVTDAAYLWEREGIQTAHVLGARKILLQRRCTRAQRT